MKRRKIHDEKLQIVGFCNFLQAETVIIAGGFNGILQKKRNVPVAALLKSLGPHQLTASRQALLQSIAENLRSFSPTWLFQSLQNEAVISRYAIRSAPNRQTIELLCFDRD